MARKPISQEEANAYKTMQEGKAAIVTAWMPVIKPVIIGIVFVSVSLVIYFLTVWLGIDWGHVTPILKFFKM
jgi:hypothetical protein